MPISNSTIDNMCISDVEWRLDSWFGYESWLREAYCDAPPGGLLQAKRDCALAFSQFFRLAARKIELFAGRDAAACHDWLESVFGLEEREVLIQLSIEHGIG